MSELVTFDNTRLSDFKRCPRYYMFRHVNHWVPASGPSLPLSFGGAWHEAMDVMWQGIQDGVPEDELVIRAYATFVEFWISCGLPDPSEIDLETQKEMLPRTPSRALEMLYAYYEKRHDFIRSLELLTVERSFVVPLKPDDPNLFYVGKIDKTTRMQRRLRIFDHKTTTSIRKGNDNRMKVRPLYLESFSPNSQMDGYIFNMTMNNPEEKVDCWVDVAMVHREDEDFQFVPIDRTQDMLDCWLSDTLYWVDRVETQRHELMEATEYDPYLTAFPKNTDACFDFNTSCPYLPLCKSRPNPLTWDDVPPGYKTEKWDPLAHAGNPELK